MSKALREFKQFLMKYEETLSNYEKKLAKIILSNFNTVEETSSVNGKRGKHIAELISKYGDIVDESFSLDETSDSKAKDRIKRLSSLSVKNFRGFSDEHVFEFKNPYTFIYGPNGSGKSSFCEALEYSLLGTINEADSKRINLNTYIKNVYTNKSDRPILKGCNFKNDEFIIESVPQTNEFCFIERNRIEGFARVSANTQQTQQQRLAALFGLEDFNTFVKNFNERLDNYLDCEGKFAKELSEKEKKIELHKRNLENLPLKKDEVKQRADELLSHHPDIHTLEELKEKLSGTEEVEGLIQKNNTNIVNLGNLKNIPDPGIDQVIKNAQKLDAFVKEGDKARASLQNYKDQLSLTDLYTAILKNKKNFQDVCPACESELYIDGNLAVPQDPFSYASDKIQEFQTSIKLEARLDEIDKLVPKELTLLKTKFTQILSISETIEFPQKHIINTLNQKMFDDNENELIKLIFNHIDVLNDIKEHLILYNKKVAESEKEIDKLKNENKRFEAIVEGISSIWTKMESIDEDEKNANKALDNFSEENKELIEQVEKEKLILTRNNHYNEAYITLKSRLEEYNRQLPSVLASNLNAKTLEFYNAINRYDHPTDILKDLKLPSNSGDKIEIRFKSGSNIDALHVLSEGHIKCLGLSILLAKNVEENLPILIFDDVVNAIDDEHRLGIIETILENENIKNKQLFITTHGEEFIKQLEINIPKKDYKDKVTRIDFLKTDESQKIMVKLDLPRNYLVLAQQRLDEGQFRDSLANGRRALESLVNKLWKKLAKKYNVPLNVSMRAPGRPPDLMSTTQALKKFISKNKINEYEDIVCSLNNLLGIEDTHPVVWNYLNKGTHEEDRFEEFDKIVIKKIMEQLEILDDILMK